MFKPPKITVNGKTLEGKEALEYMKELDRERERMNPEEERENNGNIPPGYDTEGDFIGFNK